MTKSDFQKLLDALPDDAIILYERAETAGMGGIEEPRLQKQRMCEIQAANHKYWESVDVARRWSAHRIIREVDVYILGGVL